VKDRHVNEYIQTIIGENYTAKDFRTWAGTLLMVDSMWP
jgi:DNA topoisomerase-1